ncbi:MAG: cell filamentation protein Fic [Rickettsiales bacterium]|nr:MAG: cell filamentation protein Fic [Rickettsiales bacterium]
MSFSPKFQITNETTSALTAIERTRGFLDAATLSNEWIEQMQERALILEAYHTTHIEGTQLTLEQSEQLLAGKKLLDTNPDDVKELLNYRKAFELVADYLNVGEPITNGLVREIHKELVIDVRGNSAAPGEYRKIQNYVVNSKTGKPVYTPPPAFEVPIMMSQLTDWINTEESINPILVAGIAQFQFVHIHPFLDGNGRTGRLLSTLCLYRKGYDFKKLFSISEFYDRDRANYYKAIQSVRENDMDMTNWLEYFTRALSTQMQEIRSNGEQIIKLDILKNKYKLNPRQQNAVKHIMKHGSLTIKDYETIFPKINRRTLQRELKAMVEYNVIKADGLTNQSVYKLTTNPL